MRPYGEALAQSFLTPQAQPLTIGQAAYRVERGPGQGTMVETIDGIETRYPMSLAPDDAPAHFNLGLLLAERGDAVGAQAALRAALAQAPDMAEVAYNLGLLLGPGNPREATALCRKAYALRPDNPRYAHALALLLHQDRQDREALAVLGPVVAAQPGFREAALLYARLVSGAR